MTTPTKRGSFEPRLTMLLLSIATDSNKLFAVGSPEIDDLKWYMEMGATPMAINEKGETAAHIFARRGLTHAVETIVDVRRDVLTITDKTGHTVATRLAEAGDIDAVIHYANICPEVRMQGVRYAVQASTKLTPAEKRDALEALNYAGF